MTNLLSPRQESFVRDMLADVFAGAPDGTVETIYARNEAAGLFATREAVRHAIDTLIVKRDAVRAERRAAVRAAGSVSAPTADVPAGCYALDYEGTLRFYRFKAGKGRHEGRVFCNRFRSDYLDRVPRNEETFVREVIATDIAGAAMRFVTEKRCCHMCGRNLTDVPTAIANGGYGPECVKKI